MRKTIIKELVAVALAAAFIVPVGCAREVQSTPKQSDAKGCWMRSGGTASRR